ncbi:MAG: protein kinase [Pseudomonadota bacterium]
MHFTRRIPVQLATAALTSQFFSSSHANAQHNPNFVPHLIKIESHNIKISKASIGSLTQQTCSAMTMNGARFEKNIYLGQLHARLISAQGEIWKLINTLSENDIENIKTQYGNSPGLGKYKTPPGSRGYVRFAWNAKYGYCAVKKFHSACFEEGLAELKVLQEVSSRLSETARPLLDYSIAKNSKNQSQVYLFMRWVPGTDGVDFAMQLYESTESDQQIGHTFLQVAQQLFANIAMIHEKDMVHRDIKLENVMMHVDKDGTPHVQLIDFGDTLTNLNDLEMRHMLCGTSGYIPPEALLGEDVLDPKVQDIWASLMAIVILLTTRISPNLSNDFHQNLANQEQQLIDNKKSIKVVDSVQQHLEIITKIYAERMGEKFKNSEMQWCLHQLKECFKHYAQESVSHLAQVFSTTICSSEK